MSSLFQPKVTLPGQIRSSQWFAPLVIVLVAAALMAAAIVAGNDKPASFAVDQPQSGPSETKVARAIGTAPQRATGGPSESAVAASVAPRPTPASPLESRVAAAVAAGAHSQTGSTPHTTIPVGPLGR
jgi:hypothetical protein